jgi:hypothetical protein
MLQQQQQQRPLQPREYKQPRRRDLVFHFFKTLRLVGDVLWDRRVSLLRKGIFVVGIGVLLILLLFPEVVGDGATLLAAIFPLFGVELPAEGVADWLAFALASFSLLSVFPKEIVGEHYEQLFRR